METNLYSAQYSAANTNGYANNSHIRSAYIPLEEAAEVPAVKQYVDIVKADGGAYSQLGEQAVSSFLLWATEAKACASTLTRQCMVNKMSQVHTWTGGGMHAPTDPGNNKPPSCGNDHQADRHHVLARIPDQAGHLRLPERIHPARPAVTVGGHAEL